MSSRLGAALLSATGVLVALSPGAAGAARMQVIAKERGWTSVSAYGGRLVWSSYDPKTRLYHLKTRFRGRTTSLPVRPRRIAFDIDLGPDGRGGTVAAFSRCKHESTDLVPKWRPGYVFGASKCDVHTFDFRTRRERNVPGASSPKVSEVMPSVWGSRLAYARAAVPKLDRLPNRNTLLFVVRMNRPRQRILLRGGTDAGDGGPEDLDLRGTQIAYTWLNPSEEEECMNPAPGSGGAFNPNISELWLDTLAGAHRLVQSGCTWGPIGAVDLPALSRRALFYWLFRFNTDGSSAHYLVRANLHTGASQEIPLTRIESLSADGSALFFTTFARGSTRSPYGPVKPTEVVRLTGAFGAS